MKSQKNNIEKVKEKLVIQGFSKGTKIEVALVKNGHKIIIHKEEVGKQ